MMAWKTMSAIDWEELANTGIIPIAYFYSTSFFVFCPDLDLPSRRSPCPPQVDIEKDPFYYYRFLAHELNYVLEYFFSAAKKTSKHLFFVVFHFYFRRHAALSSFCVCCSHRLVTSEIHGYCRLVRDGPLFSHSTATRFCWAWRLEQSSQGHRDLSTTSTGS